MVKIIKAGIYARVSTEDQHPENQIMELREYAKRRQFETVEFIEQPVSGKHGMDKRPKLKEMMDAARRGKFDVVVCWELSRFARSMKQLVDMVADLGIWNVGFTTMRENIDTTTANGRLIFHIFSALAEFERELIIERTKVGMKRAKKNGVILGRPQIEKHEGRVVTLHAQGLSYREIEREIGISRQTVMKTIRKAAQEFSKKTSVT